MFYIPAITLLLVFVPICYLRCWIRVTLRYDLVCRFRCSPLRFDRLFTFPSSSLFPVGLRSFDLFTWAVIDPVRSDGNSISTLPLVGIYDTLIC